jgi:hypothetical protein
MLAELNEWTDIIGLTKDIIKKSVRSDFKAFEDAIQYNCGRSLSKMDFIVTRDTKDFKSSSLTILTPKEAVSLVKSTSR